MDETKPQPAKDIYRGVAIGICDKQCPHFSYFNGGKIIQECGLKGNNGGAPTNSYMFSRICELWAVEELRRLRELAGEPVDEIPGVTRTAPRTVKKS